MEKEHKSIFTRIKEYKGNPIDEYNKISNMLSQECYDLHSIFDIFEDCFKYSKLLSVNFVNLRDCIRPYCDLLDTYCQSNYSYLDDKIKDDLLDSFLTYCEIVLCMFYVSIYWYIKPKGLFNSISFDKGIFNQFLSIIDNSLKSMNYKIDIEDKNNGKVRIIKDNPIAEMVASESPEDVSQAIMLYLGTRDSDIKGKESHLHELIDLLEPTLRKYSSVDMVGKIKEYVQLIRHPKEKSKEKQYEWFFNNKEEYLDKLFSMCIFVQQYAINKEYINEFESNKNR